MHKNNKRLIYFFTVLLLGVFAFNSCQTETETKILEVSPVSSTIDTGSDAKDNSFLVKDASYIIHYKQKVLKDSDSKLYVSSTNEGFEQADAEDKTSSPVKLNTKISTLAKNYEGFSYKYAIQKNETVYIYYTRNTVEYSFYKDAGTLAAKIQGTYGLTCTPPDVKIDGKVVTKWNTSTDGSGTAITGEFGSVNASYYPNGTGIGTKYKPTEAGDIVFSDGTAATTAEVTAATGDIKDTYQKQAIAVIVFDHYDKYTGSTTDGKSLIGVGIQALNTNYYSINFTSTFNTYYRNKEKTLDPNYFATFKYGYDDLKYLRNNFPDNFEEYWTAFYLAEQYAQLCKSKLSMAYITDGFLNDWYLPCWNELGFALATDYKFHTLLNNACLALNIACDFNINFWSTPSASANNKLFAAYVNGNRPFSVLNEKNLPESGNISNKNNQWNEANIDEQNNTPEKMQILPFREFK